MAEGGKVGYCHEEGERQGIQVTSYVKITIANQLCYRAILLSDVYHSAVLKVLIYSFVPFFSLSCKPESPPKIDVCSCHVAIQRYHTNGATVVSSLYLVKER